MQELPPYPWHDQCWLARRSAQNPAELPLNIYLLHPGSWRRGGSGETLSYREITTWLVPYVKQLGFTHVMLLSALDHLDASGGFLYLVDELHRAGVGVLLDCPRGEDPGRLRLWLEACHMDGLRLHQPDELLLSGSRLPWRDDWTRTAVQYMALDPYFHQFRHKDLTAPPQGGPCVLPLDRETPDGPLLERMHGGGPEKFASVRVLYTYLLACPGKKALWMGSEFGQRTAWSPECSLDWHLLEQEDETGLPHRQLHAFFKAANAFYLESPALWQRDADPAGIQWLCRDDAANTAAFLRFDKKGRALLAVFNFSTQHQSKYPIGIPRPGRYQEVFRTEPGSAGAFRSKFAPCHDTEQSLFLDLPPLSAVILKAPNQNKQVMK